MSRNESEKRGYLNEPFRLFYIRDQVPLQTGYHYHDFDKIVIFLAGKVTYSVQGQAYNLNPWDILLIGRGEVHRPEIDLQEPYERYILWIRREFLQSFGRQEDLTSCFDRAAQQGQYLLRPSSHYRPALVALLEQMRNTMQNEEFGHELLLKAYFVQFMVQLNRLIGEEESMPETGAYWSDSKFASILEYIQDHLSDDLSLDALCERFYISKSHLMNRFKTYTGISAHQYIRQRRLLEAAKRIAGGTGAMTAAQESGFGDYSSFQRAFKHLFGVTPAQFSNTPEKFGQNDLL